MSILLVFFVNIFLPIWPLQLAQQITMELKLNASIKMVAHYNQSKITIFKHFKPNNT